MDKWMPEVGQECEHLFGKEWKRALVIGETSQGMTVVEHMSIPSGAISVVSDKKKLRPIKTAADKYRDEQIKKLKKIVACNALGVISVEGFAAEAIAVGLFENDCRILVDDERIVKPLTDEQIESMTKTFNHPIIDVSDRLRETIDAVQRELGVID